MYGSMRALISAAVSRRECNMFGESGCLSLRRLLWRGSLSWSGSRCGIGGKPGESNRSIGRRLGRSAGSIRAFVEASGGVRPAVRRRSIRQLSLVEREEISRGVAAGESLRVVGRRLGRAPSTICRELARNGGRGRYRAHRADRAAWQRARRPQGCKLASNPTLRAVVEGLLVERWSPQQIAGRLARTVATRRCA